MKPAATRIFANRLRLRSVDVWGNGSSAGGHGGDGKRARICWFCARRIDLSGGKGKFLNYRSIYRRGTPLSFIIKWNWHRRNVKCQTCLGVRGPLRNLVSAIKFRFSSSVPPRPSFMEAFGFAPLPDDPLNLRLLFSRLNPHWLLSLPLLFRLLLLGGLRNSSCEDSWTLSPFGVIPVTRIMCVGRRRIVGMGSGSSPCCARAVNESAHNFLRTPERGTRKEVR